MERLLRRYARRNGETLRATGDAGDNAPGGGNAGAHLDADEMNAYAENALPEAARSRYFAHLADCETCRKLVTELTLAASVSNEGKARVAALDIKPPTSWRKWLAAIFSPPVLRYGVPALALFAVVIVAIVATRSQRDSGSVALNKDESRYSAPANVPSLKSETENTTATGTAQNHSNSNVGVLSDQPVAQPGVSATPVPATSSPMEEDAAPSVSQEEVARSETSQAADAKTKAGEFGAGRKREQADVAAAPPTPASDSQVLAAPAPIDERRDQDKPSEPKKTAGKDNIDELPTNGRAASGAVVNKPEARDDRNVVGGNATTTTARAAQNQARRRPPAAAKSVPADMTTERERKESQPATVSVGGRHFQKQGNAWVDTNYNSSRPTTNIHRGSEQYRALVADEPGLRSITQQLGGEVIVVWKSRAYRFY
jgi:hypothetical protein